MGSPNSHKACHCCGLVHRVPAMTYGDVAKCSRCATTLTRYRDRSTNSVRTAILALAAFIFFWPAVLLPILEVERFGQRSQSSILSGSVELLRHGEWFVGLIVLLFSVVFPLTKIAMLLELSVVGLLHRRHRAFTYRLMEMLGRWSMMDVLLLAFLVMLIKVGSLVEFHLGPAVFAFVACVAFSMTASLSFDPHAIWDEGK